MGQGHLSYTKAITMIVVDALVLKTRSILIKDCFTFHYTDKKVFLFQVIQGSTLLNQCFLRKNIEQSKRYCLHSVRLGNWS